MKKLKLVVICFLAVSYAVRSNTDPVGKKGKKKPRNVVFILTDDHRYDYMGFTGKVPWLKTLSMDKLAVEGAYFSSPFVT
ncbi:hypothetical protein [Cytophaga sp. FL35]|uniref:hypothetical protein n=1 Tax=Cytophaga sp. FL35 TaxID=1904456 RepID=UPI001CA3C990|nr:hypothetical protein [Cytophaga sp. FL35]